MGMLATHFNAKLSEVNQREAGASSYLWISMEDGMVRSSHAANHGKIFSWKNPPSTGHPGEDYNCRCFAEPIAREKITGNHNFYYVEDHPVQGIEPFYPEALLGAAAVGKLVTEGIKRVGKAIDKIFNDPTSKRPKGVPKDWKKVPFSYKKVYKHKISHVILITSHEQKHTP